ncbi:MAG: LysR family transcriptional regulator [Coriobacteriales bacterium]|nr:LysR family transcriptional regulator [Coriobacteriales bacterium]
MTLQQLRYFIEIANSGSFNSAAKRLYISQSTLSTAIHDLERELGIQAFMRSNHGITLTNDGTDLLAYARQVVDEADLLKARYAGSAHSHHSRLSISTQHYAFSVEAFVSLANSFDDARYDFSLRETRTSEIIKDVREFRSDLGILYLDSFNERALLGEFDESGLEFNLLFEAKVHIFVGSKHPLAQKTLIAPQDLIPYPRYSFEQGTERSFHYSEEPLSMLPHDRNITFSDRGTLTNLLTHGKGYTLSTGVLSIEMQSGSGIVAIPLETDETMRVGYIVHKDRKPSELALRYIDELKRCVASSTLVTVPPRS